MPITVAPDRKEAIIAEVCARLSKGETLRSICRSPGLVSYGAIYNWVEQSEDYRSRIAQARDIGYDVISEQTLDIADDGSNDWMERNDPSNPGYALNGEHVQRSKLRVETRLKLLAKWSPKKYGDKTTTEIVGDASRPLAIQMDAYKNLSPEELDVLLRVTERQIAAIEGSASRVPDEEA